MIKMTLTVTDEFLITARNEKSNIFYIRPKQDFITEKAAGIGYIKTSPALEGFKPEAEILNMMSKGMKFYTYYNEKFTPIHPVDGNAKSISNDTTKDNINSLPVINLGK